MSHRLTQIRLAIGGIGVGVWGYGYAIDHPDVRLTGIGLLALSLVLRFYPARSGARPVSQPDDTDAGNGGTERGLDESDETREREQSGDQSGRA